jgi:iron complex transport system substrate-binding protein
LIELCGWTNVVGSAIKEGSSSTVVVTKESVLLWNPNVIVTANPKLITQINNDETWQQTQAVKNHRVHLIPTKRQSFATGLPPTISLYGDGSTLTACWIRR